MHAFQKKILIFWFFIAFPAMAISTGRTIVKNFCDQPVILFASAEMDCDPSGIDLLPNKKIQIQQVPSGEIKVCTPLIDDGQNSYSVKPIQQDTPRELLTQSYDLPQDGTLIAYCVNSGSLGPCECTVTVESWAQDNS